MKTFNYSSVVDSMEMKAKKKIFKMSSSLEKKKISDKEVASMKPFFIDLSVGQLLVTLDVTLNWVMR